MAYNPQDYYSLIAQAMGGTNPNVAPVNAGDQADGEQVPAYILEALKAQQEAQQGQQAPDTPLGQAMAPQAPATPLGQAMDPSGAPQQPPQAPQQPSFMDRLNGRQDSNSIYDGLINGGAAMIGAKNLKEGLAANITGFNDGYDAKTTKDREINTPKVTPLADGAFSSVQYPGKAPVIMRNDQVADYQTQQKVEAAKVAYAKMETQARLTNDYKQAGENRKIGDAAQNQVDAIDATIQRLKDAGPAVERYGTGHRIAAATGTVGNTIAGAVDPQIAIDNQQIGELNVQAILSHVKQLPGSASDKDVLLLSKTAPQPGADPAVLKDWYARALEATQNLRKKAAEQAARADNGGMAPVIQRASASQGPTTTSAGGVQNVDAVTAEMRRRGLLK